MGRMMRVFARGWLVLELTGSPFLLALVTSAITWPMAFVPLFAGIVADRMDRRRLLLYTEFALVVLWSVTALIITLGLIQWWHLMITSFLSGTIQSFGRTGHQALLGNLVDKEELPSAVALNDIITHWPQAAGLAAATILIATIGIDGVFWITAFGQLFTAITLLFIRWKAEKAETTKRSMGSSFVEGMRHVKGEPVILSLVMLGLAGSLIGGFSTVLLPFFARDILGVGAQGLGVMMTSNLTGISLGAAAIMLLSNTPHRGMFLVVAKIAYVILLLSFARSEVFYLSVAIVFGIGIFSTISQTINTMMMQMLAPDHLRGRVMSLRMSMGGLNFVGVLGMGALAEFVGPATTVLMGATAFGIVVALIFITRPQLRRFR